MEKKLREELKLPPSEKEPVNVVDIDVDTESTDGGKHEVTAFAGDDRPSDIISSVLSTLPVEHEEAVVKMEEESQAAEQIKEVDVTDAEKKQGAELTEEATITEGEKEAGMIQAAEITEADKIMEVDENEDGKIQAAERKEEDVDVRLNKREKKKAAVLISPYTGDTKRGAKKRMSGPVRKRKQSDTTGGEQQMPVKKSTAESSVPPATVEIKGHDVTETARIPKPLEPTQLYNAKMRYELISKWIAKNIKRKKGEASGLRTVVKTIDPISCRSLGLLYSETGWLTDEHIDAHLHLLNLQNEKYHSEFVSVNWTCMGSLYSHTVKFAYTKFVENRTMHAAKGRDGAPMAWADVELDMCRFVQGQHENWQCKAWLYVDFVYGIENIARSHWAAYAYSFTEKVVYVYDSMVHNYEAERREIFNKHAAIAPSLYNECCNHPEGLYDVDIPFEVIISEVPQQLNGYDCGVYALKFIQCLVKNGIFKEMLPEHFPYHRKKLACDLIKWTKKGEEFVFYEQQIK